jgi:hypothetical protein
VWRWRKRISCGEFPSLKSPTADLDAYWTPRDLPAMRERLLRLGYPVSEIVERDYGQTEFLVTDDDGYSHRFGVESRKLQQS